MDPVIIRRLLVEAPEDALCDACLAFAVREPLLTVRKVTQHLGATGGDFLRVEGRCASCRRQTMTTVYLPESRDLAAIAGRAAADRDRLKCARCSVEIVTEEVVSPTGETYHASCWRILFASKHLVESRRVARRVQERLGNRGARPPAPGP
jgi:hypothetical protein